MQIYKFTDLIGNTEVFTLNYGALARLSKSHKDIVNRYFYLYRKNMNEPLTEAEKKEIIYTAYAAANQDRGFKERKKFHFLTDMPLTTRILNQLLTKQTTKGN